MNITKIKFEIEQGIKKIKWFYQRGKNGFSEVDCINIGFYLLEILPKMLDELIKNHCGIPANHWHYWEMRGYSEQEVDQIWTNILSYIKWNLEEANEDTCSLINPYQDVIDRKWRGEKISKDLLKKWADFESYQSQYRNDRLNIALDLIKEYFWDLWD